MPPTPLKPTSTSSLSIPNTYIYKILPPTPTTTNHIAAILSDDTLRLLDAHSLREIPDGVLRNVHEGVTCLEASGDGNENGVWTVGRDGVVRGWDLRVRGGGKGVGEFRDDSKAAYISLCCTPNGPAVGTELTGSQASVLIWDNRAPKTPKIQYTESHNDDITVIQTHPNNPHALLTGSTDGLVNIYATLQPDPDDALTQITNHNRSIHHAGFLPPSGTEFFALSYDEDLSVYGVDKPGEAAEGGAMLPAKGTAFGDLRGVLGCEYVVDIIPSFVGRGEREVVVGAGSHSEGWLDLVPLRLKGTDWEFDLEGRVRLPGAHGEEIVRSMCFASGGEAIFTAGEDGKVRAWWMGGEGKSEEREGMDIERGGKKRKKRDETDDGRKGRYKPY